MKSLELLVERIILSSRWILVVFYLGLVAALAVYAVSFLYKFVKVAKNVFVFDDAEMILAMLGLIDAALVASLILMVMIAGYENFVSRFDEAETAYLAVSEAATLDFERRDALADAARARARSGDHAGAADLYRQILEDLDETHYERGLYEMRLAEE